MSDAFLAKLHERCTQHYFFYVELTAKTVTLRAKWKETQNVLMSSSIPFYCVVHENLHRLTFTSYCCTDALRANTTNMLESFRSSSLWALFFFSMNHKEFWRFYNPHIESSSHLKYLDICSIQNSCCEWTQNIYFQ